MLQSPVTAPPGTGLAVYRKQDFQPGSEVWQAAPSKLLSIVRPRDENNLMTIHSRSKILHNEICGSQYLKNRIWWHMTRAEFKYVWLHTSMVGNLYHHECRADEIEAWGGDGTALELPHLFPSLTLSPMLKMSPISIAKWSTDWRKPMVKDVKRSLYGARDCCSTGCIPSLSVCCLLT